MRRLLEWLDVGHIVSGTAHVAVGALCLTVVGGALVASATSTQAVPVPSLVAQANPGHEVVALRVGAGDDTNGRMPVNISAASLHRPQAAASLMVPAVYNSANASAEALNRAMAQPVLKIKLKDLEKERQCLVEGIYYEARGERAVGQLAVAEVVLNRVLSGRYPATICGVVFQGASAGRCQFSFACDNSMKRPRNKVAWRKAQRLAHYVLSGKVRNSLVGSATYYHANYVNPYWAPHMVEVAKIGTHVFYSSAADGLTDPRL
jgi:hypothetical protein